MPILGSQQCLGDTFFFLDIDSIAVKYKEAVQTRPSSIYNINKHNMLFFDYENTCTLILIPQAGPFKDIHLFNKLVSLESYATA